MSTFLTLHSKKALFTHGNLTAKSSGENSVELFKVDGGAKTVTVTKDADTIFKQSGGSIDLLKIAPDDDQITSQGGVLMKTLDGNKTLLSLDASNTKLSTDAGLTTKTNVNLQTESGTDLLILDAVSTPSVTSLQAPYLEITNQFKTSGETELDGAVNISGVTTVDNKLNVNGTIDINGGDLILDENSQLIVAGGSELNVIGDEGIHWFSGGLDSSTTGGYAPTITIGGSSVSDFSGEYVRKTGLAMVALPSGNGDTVVVGNNSNGESSNVMYFTNAEQQLTSDDYFFHKVHKAISNTDTNITYPTNDGEYYWNKAKGSILIKQDNNWLSTTTSTDNKFYRSQYEMAYQKSNNRNFRRNGQTQWVLLRNTAWINQDDMPQFSYDTDNSTQTNGYFKPVTALTDASDANILTALRSGEIPFGTTLDKLWNGVAGNYNYSTVVNEASIRKFHLPHFSDSTLFNKVVDNDAIEWATQYTTGSTSYDTKEYTVLFTLNDIVAPTFDSSGASTNTIPYSYYLTTGNTDGAYFGYFVKKYNLALTVEETSNGSNVWKIKTDVNNDYRYYEAQLPTSDSKYHYRYIMNADSDFGKKFFSFMIGETNGITNGQGWFVFSTTQKLNPGVSEVLGEFNFTGTYVFNDDTEIDGHPQSQFKVNSKDTKFVPIDGYYTAASTTSYDTAINRDSQLIPYHEDHEDGQTMGIYNYNIGWHSNTTQAQYNIGWGYPFTSNGGDVTLSNLNIRGNMAALGNSYVNTLYGGTSSNNSAPPLLVTTFGTSLTTTPLDYYESTAKKSTSTPFFSVVPDSLSVEVKDQAQLDVQTTTVSTSTSSGALVVAGGVGIGEKLNVANNSDLGGTLIVSAATTLHDDLSVSGSSTLNGTLGVTGVTTISNQTISTTSTSGALVVSGGVGIGERLNVANNTVLGAALNVGGNTTLTGTLGVTGVTTIDNTTVAQKDGNGDLTQAALLVSGGVGIEENLLVKGAANVGGDLTVTGATSLDSTLSVTEGTVLKSTLSVTGVTTINDTSEAQKDETSGDLTQAALLVSGGVGIEDNLLVKDTVNVGSALTVTGSTTIDGNLSVTGSSSLASTLGVVGATTLSNALTVQTNALVVPNSSGAITMTRDLLLSSNKITCQNIEVKGTMTTINTEEINIKDNHILLNSTHTGTSDQDSGIVSVAKASNTILCTIDSTTTNKLVEVTSGAVTGANFSTGDIILVTSTATNGDNSDKNNGLYVVHNPQGVDGAVTVKNSGINNIDFCREGPFDATVAGSTQYNVSKVNVHHMYFDTDSTNGNSIKYGYGEKEDDFVGYGYLDLTQGDVRSSFEEANLSSASHTLNKSITRVTAVTSPNKLVLPSPTDTASKLVDGTTYKVINSTGDSVTVEPSGTDNGTTISVELGDGTTANNVELYAYSTLTLTYANARWYVL